MTKGSKASSHVHAPPMNIIDYSYTHKDDSFIKLIPEIRWKRWIRFIMGSRAPLFKSSVHRIGWFVSRLEILSKNRCDVTPSQLCRGSIPVHVWWAQTLFFPDVSIQEHFSSRPPVAPQSMRLFLPVTCLLPLSLSTSPLPSGAGSPAIWTGLSAGGGLTRRYPISRRDPVTRGDSVPCLTLLPDVPECTTTLASRPCQQPSINAAARELSPHGEIIRNNVAWRGEGLRAGGF